MAKADLTIATGGPAMVKAAYGSGKPAYGVGAGNATMVIDETADIADAARNTRISKTNDNGSGCSADGNLLVDSRIYDALPARRCRREGGYLVDDREKALLRAAYWDADGRRTPDDHRAAGQGGRRARRLRAAPRQDVLRSCPSSTSASEHLFSTEKLGTVLAIFKYHGLRRRARQGAADLRDRRQGAFLRDLFVRR